MKERIRPYMITYFVWFILFMVFVLNSKTESGVPYPVAEGLFVSALCAVVFSLPVWIVQWVILKRKKSKEFRTEKTTSAKIAQENNLDQFRKELELDQARILQEGEVLISRIQSWQKQKETTVTGIIENSSRSEPAVEHTEKNIRNLNISVNNCSKEVDVEDGYRLGDLIKRVSGTGQKYFDKNAVILKQFNISVSEIQKAKSIAEREDVVERFARFFTPYLDKLSEKEKREIEKCKELLLDTYVTPLQEARRERIAALQERQRKQEQERLERERAAAELRRQQKEIAQEAIARNRRAQQEQAAQKDAYRNQRAEVVRGMSRAALLQDAIRFASTQFYITAEEMEMEYPTLSQKGRVRLLSALEKLGAVQARPGSDSWLSLVDRESAGQLIEKLSGASNTEAKEKRSIDQMDGHEFEHFCADLLRNNGFTHVEVTQASGDFGIDVLAQKDGVTYGIQCKCYSDTVGNHAVQEAFSGAQYYHRMVAVVMTNNYFTQAAIETAQRTNVLLWNRDKVLEMASSGNG